MMRSQSTRIAFVALLAASLCGCSMLDTVGSWFQGATKSKLKGERISVLSAEDSVKADTSLATEKVVLPAPYMNKEWPQPGGYATNAMYHLEAKGGLRPLWQVDAGKGSDAGSRLTAPPVIAGGRIYVLDAQTHVFAFDAQSGKRIWEKNLAPQGGQGSFMHNWSFGMLGTSTEIDPSKGFGGGVALDKDKLFVSTGFGLMFALNATSGAQLWKNDLGVPILNAPVANSGRVFISSVDNHFYALAETDGRKLWDHQGITENAAILGSTSAAVAGEFVIAPYTSGELYALRIQNGRPAWNDLLTRSGTVTALSELDDISGRPVVDRDLVFAISHSGVMAAISLSTGDRLWTRDIGGIQTPWAAGDFLYVLTSDNQLMCLSRKSGLIRWIHQMPRWDNEEARSGSIVWSGPVLVSDRLIVVSSSGHAESISPYTGALLGRMEIPDGAYIAPVVANDTLYLLTNSAQLVALR